MWQSAGGWIGERKQEIERCQAFRMKLLEAFHEKLIDCGEYDAMHRKYTGMFSHLQTSFEKLLEEQRKVLLETPGPRT